MELNAFKMDGLGNDFVIIDQRKNSINLSKQQILKICDRKYIGCDQLIYITKSDNAYAGLEFYNSDGSQSGACGNGTRCVAFLLSKEANQKNIELSVDNNILISSVIEDFKVETIIGKPKFNWNEIPLSENLNTRNLNLKLTDIHNNDFFGGIAINVGNPHIIFFVDDIEKYNLEKIGPEFENHKLFPEKCNVTLAKKINNDLIKVKVWERGAGLTKACGTAACATAVAANMDNLKNSKTEIEFGLGKLLIYIDQDEFIHMTGPVSKIEKIELKV